MFRLLTILFNQILNVFREKIKKLRALETARAAVVTQWTKKVIVEKMQNNSENVGEPLVRFKIKIERIFN